MELLNGALQGGGPHRRLAETVRETVGLYLGAGFFGYPPRMQLSPLVAGALSAGIYALLPVLQMLCKPRSHDLIVLSGWGALYIGIVVALTKSTSQAIIEIVEVLLIPHISKDVAEDILTNIKKQFPKRRIFRTSLVAASISIFISVCILRRHDWSDLCIWSLGFFVLYFTASQATLTAPFYTCFSHSLKTSHDGFFAIDPAETPNVSACKALGRHMLGYWFIVFLLVTSLIAIPSLTHLHFFSSFVGTLSEDVTRFVVTGFIIAGFFSFVFGSLVYLRFQHDLRITVFQARLAALSVVQGRYNELFVKLGKDLPPNESLEIDRLKATSDSLSKSGHLRDTLQALSTLIAASLPPVVSIVGAVLAYRAKK
jgi:hypothetical protein